MKVLQVDCSLGKPKESRLKDVTGAMCSHFKTPISAIMTSMKFHISPNIGEYAKCAFTESVISNFFVGSSEITSLEPLLIHSSPWNIGLPPIIIILKNMNSVVKLRYFASCQSCHHDCLWYAIVQYIDLILISFSWDSCLYYNHVENVMYYNGLIK